MSVEDVKGRIGNVVQAGNADGSQATQLQTPYRSASTRQTTTTPILAKLEKIFLPEGQKRRCYGCKVSFVPFRLRKCSKYRVDECCSRDCQEQE